MAKEKINYRLKDIGDWAEWWEVDFKFSDFFPFRSIDIMRMIVAEPKAAKTLCKLFLLQFKILYCYTVMYLYN